VGGLCLEGFNALFHTVNPLLEAFFQSIVDGDADVLEVGQSRRGMITTGELITVSDADAVSPSTARRAICNPSLTATHSSSSSSSSSPASAASHTVQSTTSPTDKI
jgi:hypothetical protein